MSLKGFNSWSKYTSWQSALPPSRPAKWQLDKIGMMIESLPRSCKMAILGSTIEFRDLLAEMGFKNVFVFDMNKEFYDYITPFAQYSLSEQLVVGNWLNSLAPFSGEFEVILSDLTSGNIDYADRKRFYSMIANALSPSGLFIDRILTKPKDFIDLNVLLKKYSYLDVNSGNVNRFNCEVLFCSSLLENDRMVVDSSAFYDYLLSLRLKRITDFVNACYEITPRDCIWWYSQPWAQEKRVYLKYFKALHAYDEPNESEYFGRAKMFVSSKETTL
jgi:hypothetical protein